MTKYRYDELKNSDGNVVYSLYREWEVQPPPYAAPLRFGFSTANIRGSKSYGGSFDVTSIDLGNISRNTGADAGNQAYSNFVNQIGSSSQFANNVLEANEAIGGAANRILQISRFASALRKGNIAGAAKALATPVPKSLKGLKGQAKNFGDQFLEFHFGWVPLMQDIHGAMQTLSKPDFGTRKLSSRGRSGGTYRDRNVDYWGGRYHSLNVWDTTVVYQARYGASIRVVNPNAYLASQLGLVNPAAIAWEAVPYSFVADWFGNVGQVLSSATDFVGLDSTFAYNTTSERITKSYTGLVWDDANSQNSSNESFSGQKFSVSRSAGIPGPVLRLKPFKGLSLTRGITAISLLLQKL